MWEEADSKSSMETQTNVASLAHEHKAFQILSRVCPVHRAEAVQGFQLLAGPEDGVQVLKRLSPRCCRGSELTERRQNTSLS